MNLICQIVSVVLLLVIAIEDFKTRLISLWALIGILALSIVHCFLTLDLAMIWLTLSINISFILLQLLGTAFYFHIKFKGSVKIIDQYLGKGDIFLFLIMAFWFSPLNFILFFLFVLTIVLIGYTALRIIRKNLNKQIPLAGLLSLPLASLILIGIFYPVNMFSENWINILFNGNI